MHLQTFVHNSIKADLANTMRTQLAYGGLCRAFNIPTRPNDSEAIAENFMTRRTRDYCIIAAHSRNVLGIEDWQPPNLYASVEAIKANAETFFDSGITLEEMETWVGTIADMVKGVPAVQIPEQQGTGDEQDFLAKQAAESGNDS